MKVLSFDSEQLKDEVWKVPKVLTFRLLGELTAHCKVSGEVLLYAADRFHDVIELELLEMLTRAKAGGEESDV